MKKFATGLAAAAITLMSSQAFAGASYFVNPIPGNIYGPDYLYSTKMETPPSFMQGLSITSVQSNWNIDQFAIPSGGQLQVFLCYGSGTSRCADVTQNFGSTSTDQFRGLSASTPFTYYYRVNGVRSMRAVSGSFGVAVNAE